MDSFGNDELKETRINPSKPEIDLADEEGFPTGTPATPGRSDEPLPFHHTPDTVYWYDGAAPTRHDVLLEIQPGENRWPDADEATVEALEACVEAKLLTVGIPEEMDASDVDEDDEQDAELSDDEVDEDDIA